MTPKERKRMIRLFKANPILLSESACMKQLFQCALRATVDDMHPQLTSFERMEVFSETLLEVEELIAEVSGKTTTVLN
tara:strand:- start:138 stop:371 length:234 start_codon:yes stop_codon:yes gene_type:complete